MEIRMPLLISIALIAIMLVVSAWGWTVLPLDVAMAVHWDPRGTPDGFADKGIGLFALPALAAVFTILCALLPEFEPRRANLAASRELYFVGWLGTVTVLAAVHLIVILNAAGLPVDVPAITLLLVAGLLIVLANFLAKSRSTFFMGLRLPWALSSELAWERSNRVAAYLYMLTGLAAISVLFLVGAGDGYTILFAGLVLSTIAAAVVSFVTWRREGKDGDHKPS